MNWLPIIFSLLLVPGLLMVFIPFLPALFYMFLVALVFGIIEGFTAFTVGNLAVLGGIVVLSIIVDYSAGIIGAKYGGASGKSLGCGIVGLVVGTIVFPPFGGLLGLFAGVFANELLSPKGVRHAFRASGGVFLGAVAGIAVNFILAFAFLITFLFFVF